MTGRSRAARARHIPDRPGWAVIVVSPSRSVSDAWGRTMVRPLPGECRVATCGDRLTLRRLGTHHAATKLIFFSDIRKY